MGWYTPKTCKVTFPATDKPSENYSFDGMTAVQLAGTNYNSPASLTSAANALLNIAGMSCTSVGAYRTVKEEAI